MLACFNQLPYPAIGVPWTQNNTVRNIFAQLPRENTPGACKVGGRPKEFFFEKNSNMLKSIFIGFLVEFGDTLVPL